MHRFVVVPVLSAAIVVSVVAGAAAGAGSALDGGRAVAKTTIGPPPAPGPVGTTPAVPTAPAPLPTAVAPLPTAPVPTVPLATVPLATVPVPTVPVATAGPPTTEATGLSPESLAMALTIFGLDAARFQCVRAALVPFSSDDSAAVTVLQGCGVALMPLLRGIVDLAQRSSLFFDPTATTIALPEVPGADALPEADAFYVGFMVLLQPEEVTCLATGLTGATNEEDSTALAIFERCEVSLAFTLDMLMFALAGDADDPTATTTATATVPIATVPVASGPALPTVPGPPTTVLSISPDSPLVDQFQETLLAEQGISLDDQQAACLLTAISAGGIDPEDTSAMLTLVDGCGISLIDLVPTTTA